MRNVTIHLPARLDVFPRSKKETQRLHQMHKPIRKLRDDDLPSVDSHDEGEDSWSSGIDEPIQSPDISDSEEEPSDTEYSEFEGFGSDSDAEMPYERVLRKRDASVESDAHRRIPGLPIKLADGRVQATGKVTTVQPDDEDEESEDTQSVGSEEPKQIDDVSTGARFGRPAVVDVIGNKSRMARIQGAKEQIASICQEIITDPENSVRQPEYFLTICLILIPVRVTSSPPHFFIGKDHFAITSRTCCKRCCHSEVGNSIPAISIQGYHTRISHTSADGEGEGRESQPDGRPYT